jgi:flavorubredoxin
MRALKSRLVKGRRFYAFGSYTWAGSSVNQLNALAQEMNFELLGSGTSFAQAYTKEKFNASAIADLIV